MSPPGRPTATDPAASNGLLGEREVIARVQALPALPRAVQELREAVRAETVRIERVADIVGRDQALTLAALRLANSSFYGVSGRVATLRDAVQILGLNTLCAAVTTAAVMACFEPAACPGFDLEGSWNHAIATALCTQRLAVWRGLDGDAAYTAGLLHDIGRLVLASHFPGPFAASLARGAEREETPVDAERELLGVDHAEIGGWVARHWKLAPNIANAIRLHHAPPDPVAGAPADGLLDLLHLADNVTHALDLSNEADEGVPSLSIGAWERIGMPGAELQALFAHVEERMRGTGRAGG